MKSIQVRKYSGDLEPYDESKLRHSLSSAGADSQTIDQVAGHIRSILHDGISTQKIYSEAFSEFHRLSGELAGRYKLKEAIFALGPTGYPFEIFVSRLFQEEGYKTNVGSIMEGDCVSHEIDVIAEKDDEYVMVECKFHNRTHHHCNIKVPLYIQSRFLDIKNKWEQQAGHQRKTHRGCVATNTRFSIDAVTYAQCMGLQVLSWDFPKRKGIKDLVKKHNLHPLTCLSSINKAETEQLLENGIIFCRDIYSNSESLKEAGINPRHVNKIRKEARQICNY